MGSSRHVGHTICCSKVLSTISSTSLAPKSTCNAAIGNVKLSTSRSVTNIPSNNTSWLWVAYSLSVHKLCRYSSIQYIAWQCYSQQCVTSGQLRAKVYPVYLRALLPALVPLRGEYLSSLILVSLLPDFPVNTGSILTPFSGWKGVQINYSSCYEVISPAMSSLLLGN